MTRPPLTLLKTPARPGAASFDRSHPAPHTEVLRTAWWDGHTTGFRTGWVSGVRWGIVCGACTTLCLAGLGVAAAAGLGWL